MYYRLTDNFFKARYAVFQWRCELSVVYKVALAILVAALTGLAAQMKLPIPWSPVPVTGQTFAVLLAGVLLGKYWGGISQLVYVVLGAAGIPWFNGFQGGIISIAGPTGGYLFGFIIAAAFIGWISDEYCKSRDFFAMIGIMVFANFVLIYIPGLINLGVWSYMIKGSMPSISSLLWIGCIPFVLGDIVKIIAAASIVKLITPKESFDK
jgi:biotin transport system substrate-specific component